MRYLKFAVLFGLLLVFAHPASAQFRVGLGIGAPVYGGYYYGPPPVCPYGYYDYYPYACAPYGYWGPDYFVDGVFIGVGPWWGWGYGHGYWGRGYGRGFYGRGGFYGGRG